MKSIESSALAQLPAHTKRELEAFTQQLATQLADDLSALLVFGGAARGEYHPGSSDVDLAVVLREASAPRLLSLANLLQVARYQSRFEAILLTEEEVQRAADAFPIFYSDIQSCHVLLVGRDMFSTLRISERHLRLRVEQELRECQIRLRRAVTDSLGEPRALAGAVTRKLKQMRSPLRALAKLEGRHVADGMHEVLTDAARRFEVDVKALESPEKDPLLAVDVLMQLLQHSVACADQIAPDSALGT